MPNSLEHILQSIVREMSDPSPSASNTVFVIREALGQAYTAGHRDGHALAQSLEWITKDLDETYTARKAATKQAAAQQSTPASDPV
ncbi:MAG TPA: hypothetical protein VF867_18765 [Arthrobacter sp.]